MSQGGQWAFTTAVSLYASDVGYDDVIVLLPIVTVSPSTDAATDRPAYFISIESLRYDFRGVFFFVKFLVGSNLAVIRRSHLQAIASYLPWSCVEDCRRVA